MLYKQWTGFVYVDLTDEFRHDQEETYPYFYTRDVFEERLAENFYNALFSLEHLNGNEIILKSKEILNLFDSYINKFIQEREISDIYLLSHLEILIGIIETNNLNNKIDAEICFLLSLMLTEITLDSYDTYMLYKDSKSDQFNMYAKTMDARFGNIWILTAIDAIEAYDFALHFLGSHTQKSNAALKRHEKNRKLRHLTIEKTESIKKLNSKITFRAISRKIAPEIKKEADEIGFRYSEDRFTDTIYDWIRKEYKDK